MRPSVTSEDEKKEEAHAAYGLPLVHWCDQRALKSSNTRQLDCLSRKSVHSVLRLIEAAGEDGEMSSKMQDATAFAFLWSGHAHMIWRAVSISNTDIVIALDGTSSIVLNHPSPTCCLLDLLSSSTWIYASRASKSAGGSLNARSVHLLQRRLRIIAARNRME